MKVRTAFVSNSSSTSFILGVNDKFPTVRSVAENIMDQFSEIFDNFTEVREKLISLNDPDTPVFFHTSEGTYIRKVDGLIVVATEQSIKKNVFKPYMVDFETLSQEFKNKFKYEREDYDENDNEILVMRTPRDLEDMYYYYKAFDDFYMLKYEFFGREEYLKKECPKCGRSSYTEGFIAKGRNKVFCRCELGILQQLALRSAKLEKINKVK